MIYKKTGILISILLLFLSQQASADNLNAIRVIVEGEIITEFDIRKRTTQAFALAEEKYSDFELQQKKSEIMANAIEELIDRKILVQEARKTYHQNPEKAEELEKRVDSFVKGAVEEVGSIIKFYELANKQGINPLKKRKELKEDIMVDELLRGNVYGKIIITPKEIKNYYQDHIDEFSDEEKIRFRQIMIKFSTYDKKEDARSMAEDILKKLKNGEDFETLAKEHSKDPHSSKGGLWEFEEVKDFRKDLTNIVSKLKEGEISEIVETTIGYHIFKLEEVRPAVTMTFHEAQDKIHQNIFREKFTKVKKEYLQELRQNVTIKRYY